MLTVLQTRFGQSCHTAAWLDAGNGATRRCTIARRQNIALLETLGDSALNRWYAQEAIKVVRRSRRGMSWRRNHVWS